MHEEHPAQGSRDAWLEFPGLLGDEEMPYLTSRFDHAQVGYRLERVAAEVSSYGRSYVHALHIRAIDVSAACKILRDAYGFRDPGEDASQSGTCPACETAFAETLWCPSCGLNFGSAYDPDDPRIVFVREHGGFTD